MPNNLAYLTKHMKRIYKTYVPAHIIETKSAFLKSDTKAISAVQYKPSVDKETQRKRHTDVDGKECQQLK